jgi:hypothetical protein
MTNDIIYNKWTQFINDDKYKNHFEDNYIIWNNKLNELKKYIDCNNKKPNKNNKNIDIKSLLIWMNCQSRNYKNKEDIMKNNIIYNKWTEFINDNKYKLYFNDYSDIWFNDFNRLKLYIDKFNIRPSQGNSNDDIKKLGIWCNIQMVRYKKQKMHNDIIYNKWYDFINDDKYKKLFKDNYSIWYDKLEKVKQYIDLYNKKPTETTNSNKTLALWITTQMTNYKIRKNIMAYDEIYNKWLEFINNEKYKIYFEDNNVIWYNKLLELKDYILNNNKTPSSKDKNTDTKKLGIWYIRQNKKYKNREGNMVNNIIYNKWIELINDNKYKYYFNL